LRFEARGSGAVIAPLAGGSSSEPNLTLITSKKWTAAGVQPARGVLVFLDQGDMTVEKFSQWSK